MLLAGLGDSPLCCVAPLALWAQLTLQVFRRHVERVPGLQDEIDRDVLGFNPTPARPIQSGRIVAHQHRPQLLSEGLVEDCAHVLRTAQTVREHCWQHLSCSTAPPRAAAAKGSAFTFAVPAAWSLKHSHVQHSLPPYMRT